MKILVRYHDGAVPLTILPQGDWIDLCAAETVTMHAGEFRIISLGVSMQLPEGYGGAHCAAQLDFPQVGDSAGEQHGRHRRKLLR